MCVLYIPGLIEPEIFMTIKKIVPSPIELKRNHTLRICVLQLIFFMLVVNGCNDKGTEPIPETFQLLNVSTDEITFSPSQPNSGISVEASFQIDFSTAVDTETAENSIQLIQTESEDSIPVTISFENEAKHLVVTPTENLAWNTQYELNITENIQSEEGASFPGTLYMFETENGTSEIESIMLNGEEWSSQTIIRQIPYDDVTLEITFSAPLAEQDLKQIIKVTPTVESHYLLSADRTTVTITNTEELDYYRHYYINISQDLEFENEFDFSEFNTRFQTGLNPEAKFATISDDALLTKIQEATFQYFWDFAHPVSGLARERNTSGDTVTIGGSGFGVMAILVGIHRGFISRNEGIDRLQKIVNFLESADRFHGVWPHWMHGATGRTIPFSEFDDGGDLVETAFMAQGLITVREFLNNSSPTEKELVESIDHLLDTIEWDWYTKGGESTLYWHWSENHDWQMNMNVSGYNEALIVYTLAMASKNHGITPDVYHQGWARSGGIRNEKSFYNIKLPVGFDYGGPLFFAHYSFLGMDPRNLSDTYANYWEQNRNHTLINQQRSIVNPGEFVGYSENSWGLTASDDPDGYLAHEPTQDNGTLTPTAAISSIPYTPEESMKAIHHFYYVLGDKLWGEYGFYDAFNPTKGWWADSYLAIDQGPIILMIENHRSGLLWDLFMEAPEVNTALEELGFSTGY